MEYINRTKTEEESCRDSLFNLYFDSKKYKLIEDMKSFGEQKRLPKMLQDMEADKGIYKEYFDSGFISASLRLEKQLSDLTKANEVYEESVDGILEENSRLKSRCALYEGIIKDLESRVSYLESEEQVKYLSGTLRGNY